MNQKGIVFQQPAREFSGFTILEHVLSSRYRTDQTCIVRYPYPECSFDYKSITTNTMKIYQENGNYYRQDIMNIDLCNYTNEACGQQNYQCKDSNINKITEPREVDTYVNLHCCSQESTLTGSCTGTYDFTYINSYVRLQVNCDAFTQKPTYIIVENDPLYSSYSETLGMNGIAPVMKDGILTWKIPINVNCGEIFTITPTCSGNGSYADSFFKNASLEYVCIDSAGNESPEISTFSASPSIFNPSTGETMNFSWAISDATGLSNNLTLSIADNSWEVGGSSFTWDGKDNNKRILPPGVYTATLVAKNSAGCSTSRTFNVTIVAPVSSSPCLNVNTN